MDDLISRQRILRIITGAYVKSKDIDSFYALLQTAFENILPDAQPDVPDINVGDMISRAAAIEAIDEYNVFGYVNEPFEKLEKALLELPSAHPEQDCVLKQFGDCSYAETGCSDCAITAKIRKALKTVQPELENDSTWELFDLITSVYHGKQYYFPQDNGLVYSRASHEYMSVDDAIVEFLREISNG